MQTNTEGVSEDLKVLVLGTLRLWVQRNISLKHAACKQTNLHILPDYCSHYNRVLSDAHAGWAGTRLVVLGHSSYLNWNLLRSLVIGILVLNKILTRPRSPLQKQQSQPSRRARICFHGALTHSFSLMCPRLIVILDPFLSRLPCSAPSFSFLLLSLC